MKKADERPSIGEQVALGAACVGVVGAVYSASALFDAAVGFTGGLVSIAAAPVVAVAAAYKAKSVKAEDPALARTFNCVGAAAAVYTGAIATLACTTSAETVVAVCGGAGAIAGVAVGHKVTKYLLKHS